MKNYYDLLEVSEKASPEVIEKAYKTASTHRDKNKDQECDCMDSMNMDTYSEELELGQKKVKITLEFPHTVVTEDTDRFERMLKEVYLKISLLPLIILWS